MRRLALISPIIILLSCLLMSQAVRPSPSTASSNSDAAVPHVAGLPPAAEQAMATVDPENIRAQVRFLSHDLLEGRGTGQRGGDIAAEYIATQFALYGLKPAGDNGTYMQKVPMEGIATQDVSTLSVVPNSGQPIELIYRRDFVAMDETGKAQNDLDADIVWMGYGIDAPEFNWNDYKDVDVKGKVLLMLVNEPPSEDPKFFAGKALTYYGRWTYKFEEAARKGAVGVILIHKTDMASYGWGVVRNSWSGERAYLRNDPAPKLTVASWIQSDAARNLVQACGMNLDEMIAAAQKPGFKAVPLPAKLKAHMVSQVRHFDSNNVIAKADGLRCQAERAGRGLYRALRSPGNCAGNLSRRDLQRRARQCYGLRHSAGNRAGVCQCAAAAEALDLFCGGHGGGAGPARIGISGQTSASAGERHCVGPEL